MSPLAIVLIVIGVLVLWAASAYNRLITLKNRCAEALSDIDVQLKRRFDLIPNLVETVKGYMTHEKNVLENVTKARAGIMEAKGGPIERAVAENQLTDTLKTLFAVAENYPDLKANTNFIELQREIADTENKIMASRRFYNANVQEFKVKIEVFPSNIIANFFRFSAPAFFEVKTEAERENVQIKF